MPPLGLTCVGRLFCDQLIVTVLIVLVPLRWTVSLVGRDLELFGGGSRHW